MSRRRNLKNKIIFLSNSIKMVHNALEYLEECCDEDNVIPARKKRTCWLKKRSTEGVCVKLLPLLRAGNDAERKLLTSFTRLSQDDFDHLHNLVGPLIFKRDTNMRAAIPTKTRLALTLHFLATGNSYRSMQFLFLIPQCTISQIVPETLDAIYKVLARTYLKTPSTIDEWLSVAEKFQQNWDFPNCLGAIDGKHVIMVAPPNSGSVFYNYKGSHSIVLMAICNTEYKFLYIDVGCNGRESDGGVFAKCSFAKGMQNGDLNFPTPQALPGRQKAVTFVLVGDDAFALRPNLMKSYGGQQLFPAKKIFNYRLSRCRRTIENSCGIMSSVWRVLRSPINLDTAKTRKIVLGEGEGRHSDWRNEIPFTGLIDLEPASTRDRGQTSNEMRNEFEEYFMTTGVVPWQFQCL